MHKILGENYVDLLIDSIATNNLKRDHDLTKINERYSIPHPLKGMPDICRLGCRPYHIFPTTYALCSDIVLESSGISSVQNNPSSDPYWGK